MVEVLDWDNPVDVGAARVLRSALRIQPDPGTPDVAVGHLDDPGFGKALVSGFLLNNTLATPIHDAYSMWAAGDRPEDFDPSFNPRTWIAQNTPQETRDELFEAINEGLFDDVAGPNALQRKIAGALYEKNLIRQEAGSWFGAALGAVGGAITDPLTYAPIVGMGSKWWTTGSTAIRLGKSIMHAGVQMAPQEAALWAEQDFRSWRQSLLNVGAGSVLGGGVGFFGRTLLRDNPYHPENPLNPLSPQNVDRQGARTVVPGEGVDDIHWAPGTAGAAEVSREGPTKLGQVLPEGTVTSFTPAGRALQWESPVARDMITRLLDNSAIYRNTNRFGEATGHSAEDIMDDYLSRWQSVVPITGEELITQTQKQLGEIGARRLAPADFNTVAQKLLTNTWTSEAAAELEAKYGTAGAAQIKANAEQFAAFRERVNAAQAESMRAAGVIRDDAKVERLKKEIDKLREQRDAELKAHDEETIRLREETQAKIAQATKDKAEPRAIDGIRRDLREQTVQRDAMRREIHARYDETPIKSELDSERGKAPDLGKEYGHAQLWEPGAVARDQEKFRGFLYDVLRVTPDEDWLLNTHNLTVGEFKGLKLTDPARYERLLGEWAGDEHGFKLRKLQDALEDARQREKLAKLDLNDTLRSLGILQRTERQIEVREYGRYRDALNAKVAAEKELTTNLRKEQQAIVEAATAARQQTLDRLRQHLAVGPDVGESELLRLAQREGIEARFHQRGGRTANTREVHGESKLVRESAFNQERSADLAQKSGAARQAAFEDPLVAPAAPEPELSTALAAQAERAQQVAKQLSESEARLNDLLDKQLRAEEAFTTARDLRARRKDARQALQEATRDVAAQRELASKNVGQIKAATRHTRAATPLDEAVDDIMQNLMHRGKIPASALEAVVSESGRFKARRLVLTPEQKVLAAREGWLRTDLPNILRTQDRQIAGHLGLREALDFGPGRTFESWGAVEQRIRDDYQRLIDEPKTRRELLLEAKTFEASDPERAAALREQASTLSEKDRTGRLENQRDRALKDLNGMKARLLQQTDPTSDRDSWFLWASRQMRQYNFIRYALGMFPSALPDMGSFVLQHRVIPMLAEHGREAFRGMGNFTPLIDTEARRMLAASEAAIHGMMMSRRIHEGEMFRAGGIGAPGSTKNRITARIDRVGEALSNWEGAFSGLGHWDRFWKILSGLQMMDDLRLKVGRYESLSELDRTHLASLGIGEAEARRLQRFITTHGEVDQTSNLWDPNLERWYGTREGQQAARDFRIAIQRDMNRSRYMPGLGDRPLISDNPLGRLLLQFQNFGFAFVNRYLQPLSQRAVHFHDLRAAGSFAALMAAAAVTMTIKDMTRGITPDKRWDLSKPSAPYALGVELIDRSGLMGYLSPYFDAGVTMTGLTGATRYERESTLERLLGVNAALIGDGHRFVSAIAGMAQGQEKPDKVIDKLTALAPMASLLRLGTHAYDAVANGKPARDPYR